MFTNMHTYIYTYMHTYIHTYIHTHVSMQTYLFHTSTRTNKYHIHTVQYIHTKNIHPNKLLADRALT